MEPLPRELISKLPSHEGAEVQRCGGWPQLRERAVAKRTVLHHVVLAAHLKGSVLLGALQNKQEAKL